ncbi:hypothetical protein [Brevundimonas vesicularis]|uniref:hypothetical protein n=1 Tax=Brevundimonas vesicularis TaxID=41276 RepID=UPI0038D4E380
MSVTQLSAATRFRRPVMWGVIAGLLLLPAIAMRFTAEVNWGAEDFAFAAILLIGAGLLFELAVWKLTTTRARLVAGALILLAVLVVWAEAAVGLF